MKKNEKSIEQKVEEKQANNLLNFIIAKTFARHSKLNETEFLKEIGFENSGKTEDEAIRMSLMNLMLEITNQLIKSKETFKMASSLLKTYLIEEKITENTKKGE